MTCTDYFTRAEWALLGAAGGAFIALVVCTMLVIAIAPDLVVRVRRRRRVP